MNEFQRRFSEEMGGLSPIVRRQSDGAFSTGGLDDAAETVIVEGYAARFNTLSHPVPPGVRERIEPGAFSKVLRTKPKVLALYQHNMQTPDTFLGSTERGLTLREDSNGLHFSLELSEQDSKIARMVADGHITQASFAFAWGDHRYEPGDDMETRVIEEVRRLADVSLVFFPAYEESHIGVAPARAEETAFSERSLTLWHDCHPPWNRIAAERALHLTNLK